MPHGAEAGGIGGDHHGPVTAIVWIAHAIEAGTLGENAGNALRQIVSRCDQTVAAGGTAELTATEAYTIAILATMAHCREHGITMPAPSTLSRRAGRQGEHGAWTFSMSGDGFLASAHVPPGDPAVTPVRVAIYPCDRH
jgi:hypothetical protein